MIHYEAKGETPVNMRDGSYTKHSYMVIPYAKDGSLLDHLQTRCKTSVFPLETKQYLCS
jgi:hypothetical protein